MSKAIVSLAATSHYDHSTTEGVQRSVSEAIANLASTAKATGAEVVWLTLSFNFEQRTIEERRWVDQHPRIIPGLSFVTATAQGITETISTNEGSN